MGLKKYKGITYIGICEPIHDEKVLSMHSNPSCKSVTRSLVAIQPKA